MNFSIIEGFGRVYLYAYRYIDGHWTRFLCRGYAGVNSLCYSSMFYLGNSRVVIVIILVRTVPVSIFSNIKMSITLKLGHNDAMA